MRPIDPCSSATRHAGRRPAVRTAAIAALLLGLLSATGARADVSCKITCISGEATCTFGADVLHAKGAKPLDRCVEPGGPTRSAVIVWYAKNSNLVSKTAPPGTDIATLVKDGDPACSRWLWWTCLGRRPAGQIAGASPMGRESGAPDSASTDGAAAGLPFDNIAPPTGALTLRGPAGNGQFELYDAESNALLVTLPVRDGAAQVPAGTLAPNRHFRYRWATSAASVGGHFATARPGTVNRIEAAAQQRIQEQSLSGAAAGYARASVYLNGGLPWTGQQILAQMAAEVETQP